MFVKIPTVGLAAFMTTSSFFDIGSLVPDNFESGPCHNTGILRPTNFGIRNVKTDFELGIHRICLS